MIAVEQFIHKFPPQQSGASALSSRPSQGHDLARVPTSVQEKRACERVAPANPTTTPTSAAIFSTIQSDVRSGAIRVEISDLEQLSPDM